jgi:hypothetical protein
VFSRFEGDWVYLESVRGLFSRTYRRMIRMWRAAWLCVDVDASAPHFEATDAPIGPAGTCFGPFATLKAARRHAEMLEDLFDLCRYPHVLAQSPHGAACAYKQMGRCPAPCDGSVAMSVYRGQVTGAVEFLRGSRERWRAVIVESMKEAAAAREYERAGRLKAMLDAAKPADAPAAQLVQPIDRFRFLVVQRGDRRSRSRLFTVTPGRIEPLGQIDRPKLAEQAPAIVERAADAFAEPFPAGGLDRAGVERIGLAAWHVLGGRRARGVFERIDAAVDVETIARCVERYVEQRPDESRQSE